VLGRAEVEHRSLADVEVHLLVHLLPVGEHVVVALANRKETLQGTLENVVFHEDGTIAALLVQAGKSTYVPWHSVVALARDPGSDFEAGIFD
jgi:hypothetical protein